MSKLTALIIVNNETIYPFNEPARDILIMNERLGDYHIRLLNETGCTVRHVNANGLNTPTSSDETGNSQGPFLCLEEHVYLSREFLLEFIEKAQNVCSGSDSTIARACLKKGVFSRQMAVLQDVEETEEYLAYPVYYSQSAEAIKGIVADGNGPQKRTSFSDIVIDVDEFFEKGAFPDHMLNKDNFKYSITTRPIVALTEPLHIGLANIAANFARVSRFRKPGFFGAIKAILAGITAFSLKKATIKARILSKISTIHPSAEVHPTAVVEGSVIGPGAKIGAYAVIRFSVIGEKAFIDDHAAIKFSTIGKRAYIANNNVIFFTTVYPGAFLISGPYHFSCFGQDSAIMNSIPTDYRLDGKTIKVLTKHGVKDTGLRFTGSIVGHRTRIAAGLIFAPGRAIPNDLTLYPDPGRVLTRIDKEQLKNGDVWFLKDGVLTDEPLKRSK